MFHIEIDRVLLEIGAGKSELHNLELYGPDKYDIVIISNSNNEKDANTVKEELSNRDSSYHPYIFKVFTTENMPRDKVRVTLVEKNPHVSIYIPYIKVTNVTIDVHQLDTVRMRDIIIGAKN